jgi:hypothetical protein
MRGGRRVGGGVGLHEAVTSSRGHGGGGEAGMSNCCRAGRRVVAPYAARRRHDARHDRLCCGGCVAKRLCGDVWARKRRARLLWL